MPNHKIYSNEVYLERSEVSLGYLETTTPVALENYWVATLRDDGRVAVVLLDINNEPSGLNEVVTVHEFHRRFMHQPGYWQHAKSSKERLIDIIIEQADEHYEREEYLSAEYEYKKALHLDEQSVRANFGLGLTYVVQGDHDKARSIFFRLANIEAIYNPRHKHLFNEFGIQLRKCGLYDQALEHYFRALTISGRDENLWFNMGRTLHEEGQRTDLAKKAMKRALRLNSDFKEAQSYIEHIEKPKKIEKERRKERAPRIILEVDL